MMLRLVLNVICHSNLAGAADAECAIAFLPGEIDSMLTDPLGRVGLEHLDGFSNAYFRGQCKQQVHVIGSASRGKHQDSIMPSNSGEISPECGEEFGWDYVATLLRAEDAMNKNVRIFVSHGVVPSGFVRLCTFPALTCPKHADLPSLVSVLMVTGGGCQALFSLLFALPGH